MDKYIEYHSIFSDREKTFIKKEINKLFPIIRLLRLEYNLLQLKDSSKINDKQTIDNRLMSIKRKFNKYKTGYSILTYVGKSSKFLYEYDYDDSLSTFIPTIVGANYEINFMDSKILISKDIGVIIA